MPSGIIYFLQGVADGPIKIGFTADLARRLAAYKTHSDSDVTLLGTCEGTLVDERRLHHHFRAQRFRGEWFKSSPELLQAIASGAPLSVCTPEDDAAVKGASALKKFEMSLPLDLWERATALAQSRGQSLVGCIRVLVVAELSRDDFQRHMIEGLPGIPARDE